ncbi:MAG TPA: NACHT domain-containing protein [Candidatus Limnocylindrales bacterium]|nr:NACHT domain-containing protein [Candidatus Limnocylindrales bacterium]
MNNLRIVPRVDNLSEALTRLEPERVKVLADYLRSPEFECQVAHLLISRFYVTADLPSLVRDEVNTALRLRGIPDRSRMEITDSIITSMEAACEQVRMQARHSGLTLGEMPLLTHLASMAARNAEVMRSVASLAQIEVRAATMRGQVGAAFGRVRLPHVALNRTLSWDDLYVPPRLVSHASGERITDLTELVQLGRTSVVLGDPGAGKSTLVARLAHLLATDDNEQRVPFVLALRTLSSQFKRGLRPIKDYLKGVASVRHNVEFDDHEVEYLLLHGRAIVILDGLDEVVDLALRGSIIELIESFSNLYPLVTILVTSRRVGYSRQQPPMSADALAASPAVAFDSREFPIVEVLHFDHEQVGHYVAKWFALDDRDNEQHSLGAAFLRESRSVADLRSNPLLLSLLCATYSSEQAIPRNRALLYEHCALMVFNKWDSIRGIQVPEAFHGRLRGAVKYLAWEMFNAGRQTDLPRRKVLELVSRLSHPPPDRPG